MSFVSHSTVQNKKVYERTAKVDLSTTEKEQKKSRALRQETGRRH
jgi:hypothetical protein